METKDTPNEYLLDVLQERAKELNCLYRINDILNDEDLGLTEMLAKVASTIPEGFRYPDICRSRVVHNDQSYESAGFVKSDISDIAHIKVEDEVVGFVEAVYTSKVKPVEEGYFLSKESKLLRTIADRIGQTVLYRQMKQTASEWHDGLRGTEKTKPGNPEWKVITELLLKTDPGMLLTVCRRMIHRLSCSAARHTGKSLGFLSSGQDDSFCTGEVNTPGEKINTKEMAQVSEETFKRAAAQFSDAQLSSMIQQWIQEEKASSLITAVDRIDASIEEIVEAVGRYHNLMGRSSNRDTPITAERWLQVALIRRFLTDNLDFIRIARPFLKIEDFYDIASHLIFPSGSHGKIGGKATGIFVARKIIEMMKDDIPLFENVKVPRTWFIATDELKEFLQYNNLQELNDQKYKDLEEVRIEYPHIIQLLKNSRFPPGLVKSLAMALDEFGQKPLIVRSSSILEDQVGAAFSGKYKSLFLANQGDKKQRLEAVMDAITEIYASMYSPDSVQYRAERGMLDFHEEMGIIIQEVVGRRIGPYFMPLYAGVAFSNNEFRWSPRIKREDGLIRMVMGLGTRAVDRLNDDFPILISPRQPGLRVNTTPEEIERYSPKRIDLVNLENNSFESVEISTFLRRYGALVPALEEIVSVSRDDYIRSTSMLDIDFDNDDMIVTFEGVARNSLVIKTIDKMLHVLQEKMQTPVDIEFAFDGKALYLLQCRSQSSGVENAPGPIPKDIKAQHILFTAKRHISNGIIKDISHIIYVSPEGYNELGNLDDLAAVGRAVGKLNAILPKRRFILMGPGRWGSRGDIRLGVQVSYADLNNSAVLIEIAKKKSNYVPELSFGTHFFQDLVEANIRYLPLYPDEPGVIFNQVFFLRSKNMLSQLLPDYSHLSDVLKVIDVASESFGQMLHISMNAEIGEAIGFLEQHSGEKPFSSKELFASKKLERNEEIRFDDQFWRWRAYMAERIAQRLDPSRFFIKNTYLIGSVDNGTAGAGSDIDLILHFQGDETQRQQLELWLEGWSLALAEINYLKTGYATEGLLDAHIVTDEDIANKTSFARKIGAVTDPATPIPGFKKE